MIKQIILLLLISGTLNSQHFTEKKKQAPDNPVQTDWDFREMKYDYADDLLITYRTLIRNPWDQQLESITVNQDGQTGQIIGIKGFRTTAIGNRLTTTSLDQLMQTVSKDILSFPVDYQIIHQKNDKHFKLQQYHMGVPVYGEQLSVNLKPNGKITLNGRLSPIQKSISSHPFSEEEMASTVLDHIGRETELVSFDDFMHKHYQHQMDVETVYYRANDQWHLTYHFTVRPNFIERWEYFVSAESGTILHYYNHTCHVGPVTGSGLDLHNIQRPVQCFESGGTHYLFDASRSMYTGSSNQLPLEGQGVIVTLDFQNNTMQNPGYQEITSGSSNWNNKNAVSAHYNSGLCFEYYQETFNRNSINGSGGDIVSFINVADDDGGGLDNAFWNGQYMFYGSGNVAFAPLAGSLDVAGHEMTHGVIQNEANMEYYGESGALNESFADVFGSMIDRDDWQLGEDVVNTQFFPSGALRDMSNPHNGGSEGSNSWQPAHYNERYTGNQDNGGVHINSGIPNFAFFKLATAIGKDKAEQIYYRALSHYLSKSSQFIDARIAVIEAADDLYGNTEVQAAQSAWSQVGIGDGPGTTNNDIELSENEGEEFILSTDVNSNDPNTLYLSSTSGNNFQPITQQAINRKPSVTDNGERCYFVNGNHDVYYIDLTNDNFPDTPLTNDNAWDAVAVSKDGMKLATISINIDTAIYVFRLDTGEGVKYRLYNPTFTENINSGGVLYADALEWDYTGENIIYDAYNELPNSSGDNIEYWDVGIIHVWDNDTDDFGDGRIEKLFTNLPEGVSIGNPAFSKNSPDVFAFDYIEDGFFGSSYYVLGANIETGDVGEIFANNTIGSPSYSIDDQQLIFTNETFFGDKQIWSIPLADNKIQAAGSAEGLIDVADWGIWFAQGERDLLNVLELSDIGVSLYPNPTNRFVYLTANQLLPITVNVADLQGRHILRKSIAGQGSIRLEQSGMYLLIIRSEQGVVHQKVVVR